MCKSTLKGTLWVFLQLKIPSVWCRLFLESAIVIGTMPVRTQSARPSALPITGSTTSPSQIELSVQDPISNDESKNCIHKMQLANTNIIAFGKNISL
jgi:hypothetical protein